MTTLPVPGSLIADKYRVEALLGEGGMGAVFRARHELMDKPVALKWLRPSVANDAASRDRFIREARAMARVRHPNVIDVYDVGVHQGALFLVMELLHGESFESILERGGMPIPRALRLLIESMRGAAAAHRHNIIHRDIKPENIFVVYDEHHPDGLAKVLDFGVSKLLDDATRGLKITSTGMTMGTPVYMSFEQMNGVTDLDVRADVYSFGVLLYRALTGALPFEADTFAALVVAMISQRHQSPKQLRPDLPSSIDSVVMKAMAFDRAERYASLDQLIDALTLLASTEGFLGQMTHPSAGPLLLTPKTPVLQGFSAAESPSSTPPVSVPAMNSGVSVVPKARLPARVAVGMALAFLVVLVYVLTSRTTSQTHGGSADSAATHPAATSGQQPLPADKATPTATPLEPIVVLPVPSSAPAPSSTANTSAPRGKRVQRPPAKPHAEPAVLPQPQVPAVDPAPLAPAPRTAAGTRSGTLRSDRF